MNKEISGVLKINGFHKKGNIYDRGDGIQINMLKNAIRMDDGDNEPNLYEFKNKYEVIGFLALRGIINRLF